MVMTADRSSVSLETLSLEAVRSLMQPHAPPCVSLYLPTHRTVPDNAVDLPTFRQFVGGLADGLSASHPRHEIERLLKPLHRLAVDDGFWEHSRDGIAVLASDGRARVFRLQRPVTPLAVIRDRFHLMPLVRLASGIERCHVLALTSREARLLEGTVWHDTTGTVVARLDPVGIVPLPGHEPADSLRRGDVVDEETFQPHRVERGMGPAGMAGSTAVHGGVGSRRDDVDADTEIFLRHVDGVVLHQASRPTNLPLVLVAAARLAATFRGLSKNDLLLDAAVTRDPHLMTPDELATAVAAVFAAAAAKRIEDEIQHWRQACDHDLGARDLADIGRAAVAGRVATLLVEADRIEPGRFDRTTGAIEFESPSTPRPARSPAVALDHDDVLGAVAETVLAHGGTIVAVRRIDMPTESGAAAIYRY
jgi:hypothetical protein